MQFLADVFVPCDAVRRHALPPQVLEVKYRGRNIHQVLDLTVREALHVLQRVAEGAAPAAGARRDRPRLPAARPAGDDAVGRRGAAHQDRGAPVAQGGERMLYILDEPTTGLHFDDIAKLLAAFQQAARRPGTALLVIEHNLDVIKTADWVIDLGPEGGDGGGRRRCGGIARGDCRGRGVPHGPAPSCRPRGCGPHVVSIVGSTRRPPSRLRPEVVEIARFDAST